MSLSERLNSASKESTAKLCKIGMLLAGDVLSDKDKKTLSETFDVPEGVPGRVTNVSLTKILREEGYDISLSTVDRHRRKDCGCFNLVAGK
jgi:hypothetical protein